MASVCPSRISTTVWRLAGVQPRDRATRPRPGRCRGCESIVLTSGSTASRITSPSRMVGRNPSRTPNSLNWTVIVGATPAGPDLRDRDRELAAGQEAGRVAVQRHEVRLGQDLQQRVPAEGGQEDGEVRLLEDPERGRAPAGEQLREPPEGAGVAASAPELTVAPPMWVPAEPSAPWYRRSAPIWRNADRFSSATRTFSITCFAPGTRSRLMTRGGGTVTWACGAAARRWRPPARPGRRAAGRLLGAASTPAGPLRGCCVRRFWSGLDRDQVRLDRLDDPGDLGRVAGLALDHDAVADLGQPDRGAREQGVQLAAEHGQVGHDPDLEAVHLAVRGDDRQVGHPDPPPLDADLPVADDGEVRHRRVADRDQRGRLALHGQVRPCVVRIRPCPSSTSNAASLRVSPSTNSATDPGPVAGRAGRSGARRAAGPARTSATLPGGFGSGLGGGSGPAAGSDSPTATDAEASHRQRGEQARAGLARGQTARGPGKRIAPSGQRVAAPRGICVHLYRADRGGDLNGWTEYSAQSGEM